MRTSTENVSLPQLWNLSWPLVATMFLQFSVGLADVYVAGRFAPAVQGAVGFASQLLFFFTAVANGLGVGIVAVAGRLGGKSDTDAAVARHSPGLAADHAGGGTPQSAGPRPAPDPAHRICYCRLRWPERPTPSCPSIFYPCCPRPCFPRPQPFTGPAWRCAPFSSAPA